LPKKPNFLEVPKKKEFKKPVRKRDAVSITFVEINISRFLGNKSLGKFGVVEKIPEFVRATWISGLRIGK
jgi:hypothetical protein